MPTSDHWDASQAISTCPLVEVRGEVYRAHLAIRPALNDQGYHYASGRFHRGVPEFGEENAWPALYFSEAPHIAQGEYIRHLQNLNGLRGFRLTRVRVTLSRAANCLNLEAMGITREELLEDVGYIAGQSLAAAAIAAGYEAIVVPTATNFQGANLVVFPHVLRHDSVLEAIDYEEPRLYREAPNTDGES